MDNYEEKLRERLLFVLRHFNINKSELARIADVTPANISDILTGKSKNPQMKLFINISEKLGISLNWLMKGKGTMLSTDKDLPNEEKENFEQIIKDLLYKNYLLELELGKLPVLMLNPSVYSGIEETSLVHA